MTLIFNKKDDPERNPGLHAFIAGVSFYKHLLGGQGTEAAKTFGLKQLSSPAVSAYSIYKWLIENESRLPVKLASIRLLLSPSESEMDAVPELRDLADTCTRDNFAREIHAWREDARRNSDDFTFFYFCGHGVQRNAKDAVILFEDFGAPPDDVLDRAAEIENIHRGMAPPADPTLTIARNQLYLVDACRMKPEFFNAADWVDVRRIWSTESSVDDRSAPIFYAAIPGTEAIGKDKENSIFCEAFLNCLSGSGSDFLPDSNGIPRWQVNTLNLVTGLKNELQVLNKKYNTSQIFVPDKSNLGMVIAYLDSEPEFEVAFEINPSDALPHFILTLKNLRDSQLTQIPPPLELPQMVKIKAGVYEVAAKIHHPPRPPYIDKLDVWQLSPLNRFWKVRVIQ